MARSKQKIGKYSVVDKITESNYAQIYTVADAQENNFILKLAKTGESQDNELIAREYSILSQINHPNIVRVYDYDKHDGSAYFTLEYVPGKPVDEYFEGFSEDFAIVILQILSAIGAFHNMGFVHCDLKPDNILFDASQRQAKLIDFGFAAAPDQQMLAAGTIGYMAPEVVKGTAINQRSDLYSLGVIIYEILSGKKFKQSFTPIKDIPDEINKLLSRLVSEEAALRPTIPELYQTFTKYAPSQKAEIPAYQVRLPGLAYIEPSDLVARVCKAAGEATIVIGETGLGKTRFMQELKFHCLKKGLEVIYHSAKERTNMLDTLRKYLLMQQSKIADAEDKFQIFEEISQCILEFTETKNIAILIDDIDVLSDYELALFRYIGYGIKGSSALLIGTSTTKDAVISLGFKNISLNPLSNDDITVLLDRTFGKIEAGDGKTTTGLAQWLLKQSGGNALFIAEILKTLYDKELLYYKNNQWQINMSELGKTSIPRNLEDLITPRISQLPFSELKLLKILSIANHPLPPAILAFVAERQFDAILERLKNSGLVREDTIDGQRLISITNRIIASSVEKKISNAEKTNICTDLIASIENTPHIDIEYAPILVHLNDRLGNTEVAYKYAKISAETAEKIYDYNTAASYYEKLINYTENVDPANYAVLLIKLASMKQIMGNTAAAIEHYRRAIAADGVDVKAKANVGLGKIYSTMGNYNEAINHLRTALHNTDEGSLEYINTANPLGYIYMNTSRLDDALAIFSKSLSLARRIKNRDMEADTLYYLASVEWHKGDFKQGIEKAENLLRFCQRNKILKHYAYCASLLGSLYQQMKDAVMARKYFKIAIEVFQETKRVGGLAGALCNLGLQLTIQGELKEALEFFEKSLDIAAKIDNKSIYMVSLTNIAIINSALGSYENAIEHFDKVLQLSGGYTWAIYGKAMIFLRKGRIDEAKQLLDENGQNKSEILRNIGLAAVEAAKSNNSKTVALLEKSLETISKQKPDISIQVESLLKAGSLFYETGNSEGTIKAFTQLLEITPETSPEHNVAQAIIAINDFATGQTDSISITRQTSRLKEIGCLYDYAYLKRLQIEARMNRGLKQEEVKTIVEELSHALEVFESLGAELEIAKLQKIQSRLFPFVVEDYSRRVISEQYLQTFSGIAELISSNLGDEHFVQNILDLVIKATNAERGALFVKTTKGMDFIAGRDMDQTTIKDAGALSHTAIKQMEKGKILFAQDALSDPAFNIKKSVMLNQIRSLLCIPLSVSGNVIGAIYLDSRITSGIFGPQDKDFLMTISKILASVIEKSLAFRSMSEENILLKANIIKEIGSGHLMGKSRVMKEIYRLIDSVAETNSPVLILGETGTGKGMIARLIHLRSQRKNKKFLSINCGTIPETLLESELFGHKKGAFTGAISDKKGLLEEGEGGTVFLDEITNTSLEFQGKLLEAIEEKIIRRVGETTTRNIDVRFLFATNKDLEIEVEDSRFRRDLFYRINVFKIEVPPLRDRANDIPLLAQFFLERYTKEMNKKIDGYAPEAMQRLREYFWPGNVRELQNVIERAVVLAKTNLINLGDIGFEKTKTAEVMPLKEIKKEAVIETLNLANWNITKAAKMLSIGRRSLHRYIKKFNIVNDSTISIGRKK